ncbi:ATP-binding cassette domain-containing protein [Bradyrhizobium sp. U87765 SZCCT0131]|uniref:ATP-binding cassette domain-containing protein n=2 Tax=unclassified Bradyrhizobium TaxID=2631580 RepID=UPI001BA4EE26|nr:ATP-binding cassette domain-containing protein [Bradyrhizobium sp. U87765 SZCCT0131]MBR1264479.1 ATP-binding cassette domain-containing protein [Bradyrhizobium sp. U87765 SZCCT0134]MBR1304614.1 ATP-binding cassette domain-containing protein [Bradyrhizobium sp. U87765 SZCCT0110]MBR1322529.1 ATP-binding cassette domain-containing protein [Bradyrhizobium sp. U87765 SZCCT0109]MBR1346543.1 ATP-binding cassette domain-containing protein [Bradyrhizobium sp. U87765 SZCCT0048]
MVPAVIGDSFNAMEGARKAGNHRLLALLAVRSLLRLGFLASAAMIVGELVLGQNVHIWLAGAGLGLLVLAIVCGLWGERMQAVLEAAVATALRTDMARRLEELATRQVQAIPVGQLVVALQRHPDAVAGLVIGHRAAAAMMAVGPLLAAAALMMVSWQAALMVLALTPVMILFFVLVGDVIRRRAHAQEQAFGHLAGQFADRIRTLPTILANEALANEEAKLAARLRDLAGRTMGVLRVAFLNAGIIDFFASLSIAMLAVFLGLGHLGLAHVPGFSGLALWQSLFILMIAPEYFAPFRRFAEQYHTKAEGEAAAVALDELLSPPPGYAGSDAVDGVSLALGALPSRGLVAVTGPSGAGKTTLLRQLAGEGARAVAPAVSWVSTECFMPQGTLADAIAWNGGVRERSRLAEAAAQAGLLDEAYLPGGLDAPVTAGGANLSGGQRVRIAVARAWVSGRTVFADEPTAKLDAGNARRVRAMLLNMAADRLVVVATHDRELARLADREIVLGASVAEAADA